MIHARILSGALALLTLASAAGCDDAPAGPPPCEVIPTSAYYGDGPFSVGVSTATYYDDSRPTMPNGTYEGDPGGRSIVASIYYPATEAGEDVPAASGGPFPVVHYSHGFSSTRGEALYLYQQLASRGYVVVTPTFPLSNLSAPGGASALDVANQPGDQRFLLDLVIARGDDAGDVLFGAIDAERVAAAGLSLGGMTTLLLAYHDTLADPRIDAAVAIVPASMVFGADYFDASAAPLTLIGADSDAILDHRENAAETFRRAHSPTTMVTIANGTHTGFAAFATLFDGARHADEIGCSRLENADLDDVWSMIAPTLGGAAAGVIDPGPSQSCLVDEMPPGLCPTRQISLTTELVQAALDAQFGEDAEEREAAAQFLSSSRQRHPELHVQSK